VQYVGRLLRSTPDGEVLLFKVPDPIPEPLLALGEEDGQGRDRMFERERRRHALWQERCAHEAKPLFDALRSILDESGCRRVAVETLCCTPCIEKNLASTLIDEARSNGCETLVVGRQAMSWYRNGSQRDLTNELLEHNGQETIWIVC